MSLLSELAPAEGAKHYQKRVGRGKGSGLGQTAGKGNKGQLQRTGGRVRRGFEGGQTPLHRRLPKFGFSNVNFENRFSIVNLSKLENVSGEITPETLHKLGLIYDTSAVKILGNGKLTKSLNIKAHKFSKKAKNMIEAAGGKVEIIK